MINPKPVKYQLFLFTFLYRPYKRFKDPTAAHSGINPHGSFLEFLKKDPYKNIDVHRDAQPSPPRTDFMKDKWAVGTTKHTYKMVSDEGRLDRTNIQMKTFPRNKTDNISFDPPANERPQQREYDLEMTKPKYNINVRSTNPWQPFNGQSKTINNRSSVTHNIINHQENKLSPGLTIGVLDKQVTNMKKGIGEFGDLQRPTAMNPNHDFLKAYNENPNVFKRRDGIFSHLYDAAHRFGEDKPFKA